MRRLRFVGWALIIVFLMIAGADRARTLGNFGVGVIIGEPTGIAWNYRISSSNAVDGVDGVSPGDRFRSHLDYIWEEHSFQVKYLILHYGLGLLSVREDRTIFSSTAGIATCWRRAPSDSPCAALAVSPTNFLRPPFDAFVENAPQCMLSPGGEMGINADLGVRIYPWPDVT